MKNQNGLIVRWGAVGVIAAILTVMTMWGVLPWAGKADLDAHKREDEARFESARQQASEIHDLHHLFFPGRSDSP